jgi:ABC-type oligopeptide transport system substrate-binding subunit
MKISESAILLLALFGWTVGQARAAGIEPPVLRLSSDAEPTTLDWGQARASSDRFIASFLMRGLLKYDSGNRPACDLCKSFEVTGDGKALKFVIASGVRWSDGVELEAKHFVDALARGAREEIASVRADGKMGLEIAPKGPLAAFAHRLTTAAAYPVRKELVASGSRAARSDRGEKHASTAVLGPYQLAAWEHGKRVVLEGNPEYTGERPVYRVEFVLGTHAQLLDKFKAGKIDILANPVNEDFAKLPGQKPQVSPYWATRELVFNVRRVQDVGLRRSILRALEREALPAFLRNGERTVTGLIPPGLPGHRELPLVTADPARVAQERAAQPWVELTLLARDVDTDRRVAEWVASQLQRIRVRVKPRIVSAAGYIKELEKGPPSFDLALRVWAFETASPLELLRSFGTGASANRGGWTHVGYDAWLGQLSRASEPAEAAPLIDQLTQLIETKEVAVIPLGYPTQPFILGPRVVSFAITPFGDPDLVRIRLKQ